MKKPLAAMFFLLALSHGAFAEKMPDFNLETDDGEISLSDLKGKIVYVDFWASWCRPCRKSFPWMNRMHSKYEAQGLKIIAISLDSTKKGAQKFLKKTPALFTVAYDTEGVSADAYNVQFMPTSYLIDREGKLIFSHTGFLSKQEKELEEKLVNALGIKMK